MNLIDLPTPPTPPLAQTIASEMLAGLNAEMARRVDHHAREFKRFWESSATPDEILAAMGPAAPLMLATSRENLRNIGTLAAMVGKTLDDAIPPTSYMPRREFLETETGIELLPPVDGFDAWGRLIPVTVIPEPVIEEPPAEPSPE